MYRDTRETDSPNLNDRSSNFKFNLNLTSVKKADFLDLIFDCTSADDHLPSSEAGEQHVQGNQKGNKNCVQHKTCVKTYQIIIMFNTFYAKVFLILSL